MSLDLGKWSLIGGAGSILGGGGKIDSGYISLYVVFFCTPWLYGMALWIASHKHIQEGSVPSFSISIVNMIEGLRQFR